MAPTRALMLHGAGSTGAFIRAAFEPAALGVDHVIAPDHRHGVDFAIATIDRAIHDARNEGCRVTVVGGVSLGAHAAALWAAHSGWQDGALALVMPAWTGAPNAVAAATATAAAEVARYGTQAQVSSLMNSHPDDWVVQALADAWGTYDDHTLAAALAATAQSSGPTINDLVSVNAPAAVIALADDPLHPQNVAAEWAQHIRTSTLAILPRDLDSRGATALGAATGVALREVMRTSEFR